MGVEVPEDGKEDASDVGLDCAGECMNEEYSDDSGVGGALNGDCDEKDELAGPDGADDRRDVPDVCAEIRPYLSPPSCAGGGERNTLAEAAEMGAAN